MPILRSLLLAASQSSWLRRQAPRYRFVRRTVSRFMPGEELEDALTAAEALRGEKLCTILTHLGENITDAREAESVTQHYLQVLDRIESRGLPAEVSVKPTQLGLDLDPELCFNNLAKILRHAGGRSTVWIDMESSPYVDLTLDLYRRARQAYLRVGVCLQAYLHRTVDDLNSLLPLGPAIRLVKGAYREPPDIAFPRKQDVDENFFRLTQTLLDEKQRRGTEVHVAIGTHDRELIRRTIAYADQAGLSRDSFEFEMLYGIQRLEQLRLAREGFRSVVLISYGEYWYPWFMRRLAERPANMTFVLKNLFGG